MWLFFSLSQFVTSLCTLSFFYKEDRKNYENGTWKEKKMYQYSDVVWNNWREASLTSMQNCFINCVPLYCTWKYYPSIFEVEDSSVLSSLCRLALYYFTSETYFYFVHRAMHIYSPLRHTHVYHHQSINTVAASFFDSSPFEHIILNLGTVFVPLYLIGASELEFYIFLNLGIYSSCASHSGYIGKSDRHFMHHKLFNKNFGFGFYLWDRFLGTLALN